MALNATTVVPALQLGRVIDEVFAVSSAHSDEVTPRSHEALERLALQERLALVFDEDTLAGWAVIEPLTSGLSELGMTYVKPGFRKSEVFHSLIKLISRRPERFVFATYDPALIRYAERVWGCHRTNLLWVALLSRGRFISKRLDAKTRASVNAHLKERKPLFAITDRNRNG